MEDIRTEEEDVTEGIKLIVSVIELNGDYWSGVNLETPLDRDEIPLLEFHVLRDGLNNAMAQVDEIINAFEGKFDDEEDGFTFE